MFRLIALFILSFNVFAEARPLLVVGDSISAGYGLEKPEQGWVALLRERLRPRSIEVINASISGDTSAGGLSRIDALLQRHHPAWVLVELGGNDGLRGLSPKQTEANLGALITRARAAGAKVLLLGMKMPPNYGKRFTELFEAVYPALARVYEVPLVPFLLEGIGGNEALMQADQIHPNLAAQALLLDRVWPHLEPLLGPPKP